MKYIYIIYENIEYWIELDKDDYALRQIIVDNGEIEISCKTDCLAEGVILLDELDGEVKIIDNIVFETKWNEVLLNTKTAWEQKKSDYPIGKKVTGTLKYFYPQGAVIQLEEIQGICANKLPADSTVGSQLQCIVSGYDESNFWIILTLAK